MSWQPAASTRGTIIDQPLVLNRAFQDRVVALEDRLIKRSRRMRAIFSSTDIP